MKNNETTSLCLTWSSKKPFYIKQIGYFKNIRDLIISQTTHKHFAALTKVNNSKECFVIITKG